MLEHPRIRRYSPQGSENPFGADNQQGRLGNCNEVHSLEDQIMFQRFVLVMGAKEKNGTEVRTDRVIVGDDKSIQQTASLLCRLAIMDDLRDIHVIGVYSEIPDSPPTAH